MTFTSITGKTGKKLPNFRSKVSFLLCSQEEQTLKIEGGISFLYSQKLSGSFKAFYNETSDFEASFQFQRLLVRVHAAVSAHMHDCSTAEVFVQDNYPALKKEIEGEDDMPF